MNGVTSLWTKHVILDEKFRNGGMILLEMGVVTVHLHYFTMIWRMNVFACIKINFSSYFYTGIVREQYQTAILDRNVCKRGEISCCGSLQKCFYSVGWKRSMWRATWEATLNVKNNMRSRGVSELRIRIRIRGYPHEFWHPYPHPQYFMRMSCGYRK